MGRFVREGDISVRRVTKGGFDINTGRELDNLQEEFTYRGSIQPITGEDLEKLPDGYRAIDIQVVFLHEPLEDDDIVVYNDNTYRVISSEIWEPIYSPLPHYRYVIEKEVDR